MKKDVYKRQLLTLLQVSITANTLGWSGMKLLRSVKCCKMCIRDRLVVLVVIGGGVHMGDLDRHSGEALAVAAAIVGVGLVAAGDVYKRQAPRPPAESRSCRRRSAGTACRSRRKYPCGR